MRDMNELKNAFGEADDGFKNNVYRTLGDLKRCEERKSVWKISWRMVAIVAVLCLLATGTALAMTNAWGILDFLSGRRLGIEVMPEAAKIVQTDLPQEGGESELAKFSVREAVFDGLNVYIVVEAKPANQDYLLLGLESPSDPIRNMGPLFGDKSGTIGEYAKGNGMIPIRAAVSLNINGSSYDYVLDSDGTLVCMINSPYNDSDSSLSLELNCTTAPFVDGSVDLENIQRNSLKVDLQNSGAQNAVTNVDTAEYADCGVRVDKVTLTGSPMGIYAVVEFTVVDEAKFAETNGGLWFEFIDENGDRLPEGASSGDSLTPTDDSGIRYIQTCSIKAAEMLPGDVSLRGYNCWNKNLYETHVFEMQ